MQVVPVAIIHAGYQVAGYDRAGFHHFKFSPLEFLAVWTVLQKLLHEHQNDALIDLWDKLGFGHLPFSVGPLPPAGEVEAMLSGAGTGVPAGGSDAYAP